ncbi:hypothetical protein [Actinomyces lilanjuaniae]|nr:hypothetical protein [Actinomyces lilanjuaniae]
MVAGRGALWGQLRGIVIVVAVLALLYGGVAVCSHDDPPSAAA